MIQILKRKTKTEGNRKKPKAWQTVARLAKVARLRQSWGGGCLDHPLVSGNARTEVSPQVQRGFF